MMLLLRSSLPRLTPRLLVSGLMMLWKRGDLFSSSNAFWKEKKTLVSGGGYFVFPRKKKIVSAQCGGSEWIRIALFGWIRIQECKK
jgi:hypothetical protein